MICPDELSTINSLTPQQNVSHCRRHFKFIFLNEKVCILIQISLKFVPKVWLTIRQHWFREWIGDKLVQSHYLNQWWPSSLAPDNKVHGANMGPTWVLSAPGGPHVGPMNLAIRGVTRLEWAVAYRIWWGITRSHLMHKMWIMQNDGIVSKYQICERLQYFCCTDF